MNPVYKDLPPHLYATLRFSLQITHHPIDLTSETQNPSLIDTSKQEEWKHIPPKWSQDQVKVLLEAQQKWSKISKEGLKLDYQELWENITKEVIAIRPCATPQTCRLKYNRLMRDREAAHKQDELIAIVGLAQLKNPKQSLLSVDPAKKNTKKSLKRKYEDAFNQACISDQ